LENTNEELNYQKTIERALPREAPSAFARAGMIVSMLLSDILALVLAGFFALLLRELLLGNLPAGYCAWMPSLVGVFLIVYATRGLYPSIGLGLVEEFRRLTIATTLVYLCLGSVTYLVGVEGGFSRLTFGLTWLFSLGLVPFSRVLIRHLMTRLGLWGEPVAVIGAAEDVWRAARYLRDEPKVGLRPVMVVSGLDVNKLRLAEGAYRPRTAVAVYRDFSELTAIREYCQDVFEHVLLFSSQGDGFALNGMHVRLFGDHLALEIHHTLMDPWAQFVKRAIDLMASAMGLLVLSPILALVAVLIKLDSPGPVFYAQQRVGKKGRVFGMVKFRTMHVNAEEMLRKYLAENPQAKTEWDCYQKLRKDPRITRAGKILRRFSLDELPQLWNVLIGEMSLVGPRPFMINQREMYGANLKHYERVVPGITGLWQISGRNKTSFAKRTEFDAQYVLGWSIWLDIYILIRTVWVVIIRDGAC